MTLALTENLQQSIPQPPLIRSSSFEHVSNSHAIGRRIDPDTQVSKTLCNEQSVQSRLHHEFDQADKTSKSTEASGGVTYGAPTKAIPYEMLLGQVTAETELEMFDLAPPVEVSQKVRELEWVHHASQQAVKETADRRSFSKSIRPWLIAVGLSVITALGTLTAMAGLSPHLKTSLFLPLVAKIQFGATSTPTPALAKPPIVAEKFQGRLQSIDAPPPEKPVRTLTEAPKPTAPIQPASVLPMKVSSRF